MVNSTKAIFCSMIRSSFRHLKAAILSVENMLCLILIKLILPALIIVMLTQPFVGARLNACHQFIPLSTVGCVRWERYAVQQFLEFRILLIAIPEFIAGPFFRNQAG